MTTAVIHYDSRNLTATGNWVVQNTYTTTAGTSMNIVGGSEVFMNKTEPEVVGKGKSKRPKQIPVTAGLNISPKVYFKFVKSKFSKIELDILKRNLFKLSKMIVSAEELGQRALFEQLSRQLAITVREQEAHACGYDHKIHEDQIEKFRKRVKDKVIRFEPFEKFPRIVPGVVSAKIKNVQSLGIFDEYWVLFTDYTGEDLPKTTKEKIKEKDPILFGRFAFQPDIYYYILDWIDKYCDLTIGKLIEELQIDDPEFELQSVPDVDNDYVQSIVREVVARTERLANTNSKNFKDLMEEEEKLHKERKDKRTTKTKSEADVKPEQESMLKRAAKAVRIPFASKK